MNPIVELLQQTQGTVFINEDGLADPFELLPPLTEQELAAFETSLPCALPDEMRELFRFARGFKGVGALGEVSFGSLQEGFGLEEIFPHAITLAEDGFGNSWVVDLTSASRSWGPIFYACHDAPVIVYQSEGLLRFVREAIRFGNKSWKSEIDEVHEELSSRIWRDHPGVLTFERCLAIGDHELRAFAESLDQTWQFIDLRNPTLGDGFSWGRYGAKTLNKRFGEKRILPIRRRALGGDSSMPCVE